MFLSHVYTHLTLLTDIGIFAFNSQKLTTLRP